MTMVEKWLVMIETSGNQQTIFASNRRRENVGASELIHRVCTVFVRDAIQFARQDAAVCDAEKPIECYPDDEPAIECVYAISGRALLLTSSQSLAQTLVTHVTKRALCEAPGISVKGAIASVTLGTSNLHNALIGLQNTIAQLRSITPGPEARFPRLPVIAPCTTSGEAASHFVQYGSDGLLEPRAPIAFSFEKERNSAQVRLEALLGDADYRLENVLDKLDGGPDGVPWVGVIHADGNGMGQVFQSFDRYLGIDAQKNYRCYLDRLSEASHDLDACVGTALKAAFKTVRTKLADQKPIETILPLIAGGDDLTLICDGRYALRFADDYLRAFAEETAKKPVLRQIAQSLGCERLGACAGIAIVKPHYPFHLAYALCEDLMKSAKQVKSHGTAGAIALDYHILYDSSSTDLATLRAHHTLTDAKLTARPYVLDTGRDTGIVSKPASAWCADRLWDDLVASVEALKLGLHEGKISSKLLHDLRAAVFNGPTAAEAALGLLRKRHKGSLENFLNKLNGKTGQDKCLRLFRIFNDQVTERPQHITGLLDALDLIEFWPRKTDNAQF